MLIAVASYYLFIASYPLIVRNDPLPNERDTWLSVVVVVRTRVLLCRYFLMASNHSTVWHG